jgi:hypothetical protein
VWLCVGEICTEEWIGKHNFWVLLLMEHIVRVVSREPFVCLTPSDLLDCDTWTLTAGRGLRKRCKRGHKIVYIEK